MAERSRKAKTVGFEVNGDGTVLDTKTGLMWKQCAEGKAGVTCHKGSLQEFTWDGALEYTKDLNKKSGFATYNDWRVPTKDELHSIVKNGVIPSINYDAFPYTYAVWYWSSSSANTTHGWSTFFYWGTEKVKDKRITYPVRLVRAGK